MGRNNIFVGLPWWWWWVCASTAGHRFNSWWGEPISLCTKKEKDRNNIVLYNRTIVCYKMSCKVHVLIFEILQDAFYFLLSLLVGLTKSPDYFLPHRWRSVVSLICKHTAVVKLRLEMSQPTTMGTQMLSQENVQFFEIIDWIIHPFSYCTSFYV